MMTGAAARCNIDALRSTHAVARLPDPSVLHRRSKDDRYVRYGMHDRVGTTGLSPTLDAHTSRSRAGVANRDLLAVGACARRQGVLPRRLVSFSPPRSTPERFRREKRARLRRLVRCRVRTRLRFDLTERVLALLDRLGLQRLHLDELFFALPVWTVVLRAVLRRRTRALRRQDARFRALVEHSSDVISIYDVSGTMRYVRPSLRQTLGQDPEARIGRNVMALVHPDDAPRLKLAFSRLVATPGGTRTIEIRLRHRDGTWCSFEVLGTNRLTDPTVGDIVANSRDVTERAAVEAVLMQERDLLHRLMDNLPDMVLFKDAPSRFIRINRAGAMLLGIENPSDAVGRVDADFMPPEIGEAFVNDDRLVMATRTAIADRIERAVLADGSVRWLSTAKAPIFDSSGSTASALWPVSAASSPWQRAVRR
jgi:PAS domain S-box-containing protein